jgi:hypothetical protein
VTSYSDRKCRAAAVLLALLGLAGCVAEEAPEFCMNHGPFHAQHLDEIGSLTVTMAADGELISEVQLPAVVAGTDAETLFHTPSKVYTVQTASECAPATARGTRQGSILKASYATSCGAGNKLGQLDVHLFDSLPLLEEIEVFITTPVAEKHFAINRQCENAIFRLR